METEPIIPIGRRPNALDRIDSPIRRTILAILCGRGTMLLEDLCIEVWNQHKPQLGLGSSVESRNKYPNHKKFACLFYGAKNGSLASRGRKLVHVERRGSGQAVYVSLTDLGRQVAMSIKELEANRLAGK